MAYIVVPLKGSVFDNILTELRDIRKDIADFKKELKMDMQTLSDHVDQLINEAIKDVKAAIDAAKQATTASAGTPAGQPDPAIAALDKRVTDALDTLKTTFGSANLSGNASSPSSSSTPSTPSSAASAGSPVSSTPSSPDSSGSVQSTGDLGVGTAPKLPGAV